MPAMPSAEDFPKQYFAPWWLWQDGRMICRKTPYDSRRKSSLRSQRTEQDSAFRTGVLSSCGDAADAERD
jgi:hypothetical protein